MSEPRTNSNLEFRKIKSLKFLYEINENGTILRNIKSKKQVPMHREFSGWVANLKGERLDVRQLVAECWLGECPVGYELIAMNGNNYDNDYHNLCFRKDGGRIFDRKPVKLVNEEGTLYFQSITEAANYIAYTQHRNVDNTRHAIKRRKHAFGYDIIFPNAETRRAGSTEQGIVHLNQEEVI